MRLLHQYRASTLAGIKDGYGFPSTAPCSGVFCVPGFPRSDSPIIWMLVGVPSEPAFSFRRVACNGAWNFITTHFTFPRTRHGSHGFCLSTNAMFRLVPSGDWSARAFLRILTLSIRRPAYEQRRPMWAGFGGVPLRLPSADFTELLTILRLHAASPIGGSAWTFPGVAPSFRPSDCQFFHGRDLRRRHDAQPFQLRT